MAWWVIIIIRRPARHAAPSNDAVNTLKYLALRFWWFGVAFFESFFGFFCEEYLDTQHTTQTAAFLHTLKNDQKNYMRVGAELRQKRAQ